MKALIPFLVLGSVGVAGVVGGGIGAGGVDTIAKAPAPTSTTGPLTITAAFERATLPAGRIDDTFVRVAITGAQPTTLQQAVRVPVSLTIVIDRSGSMGSEDKMAAANDAACKAVEALAGGDRAAVVSFDNGAEPIWSGTVTDNKAAQSACRAIHHLTARGSTDMAAGLDVARDEAMKLAGKGRINRVLLLSDGRPNGDNGLAERTAIMAREGITTTTIGLGTDYNEDLMSRIADAGLGNSYFVDVHAAGGFANQLASIFQGELQSMAEVVAKSTVLKLTPTNGLEIVDVAGFPSDRSGASVIVPIGDIYAGRTTDLLVRVRHPAGAEEQTLHLIDVAVEAHAAANDVAFGTQLALSAAFSADDSVVAAALVPEVAEEVEEWKTSQALLEANEAYNRGDFGSGDRILNDRKAHVQSAATTLQSAKLQALFSDVDGYQVQNALGGLGTRGSMNKIAKEKARNYQRGTSK